MTTLGTRAAGPVREMPEVRPVGPAAADLIARLRESAARMVPFSQQKILLRAAAVSIQQLDAELQHRDAEIARLTGELEELRGRGRAS